MCQREPKVTILGWKRIHNILCVRRRAQSLTLRISGQVQSWARKRHISEDSFCGSHHIDPSGYCHSLRPIWKHSHLILTLRHPVSDRGFSSFSTRRDKRCRRFSIDDCAVATYLVFLSCIERFITLHAVHVDNSQQQLLVSCLLFTSFLMLSEARQF